MIIEKQQGMVFNIQSFSINDGPGVRTTVFLKGCPLSCLWCHNPESQCKTPQLMFNERACVGCGQCTLVCPVRAIAVVDKIAVTDRKLCINCGDCTEACGKRARSICGEIRMVDEVMREVLKDKEFFEGSDGGVTFSGGEVLSQPGFLLALLKAAKAEGIHTVVDTSGYTSWSVLEEIVPYADLFLYDLKVMDDKAHQRLTGVANREILDNVVRLHEVGANIRIRIPVIPGMNDDEANMSATAGFIKEQLDGVPEVDLLPYHAMGESKLAELEMQIKGLDIESPSEEKMNALKHMFEQFGIKTFVGG